MMTFGSTFRESTDLLGTTVRFCITVNGCFADIDIIPTGVQVANFNYGYGALNPIFRFKNGISFVSDILFIPSNYNLYYEKDLQSSDQVETHEVLAFLDAVDKGGLDFRKLVSYSLGGKPFVGRILKISDIDRCKDEYLPVTIKPISADEC